MNDEQLMLYYYDDGLSRKQRRRIERALRRDPDLAQRYAQLRRELEGLRDIPPVAVPDGLQERLRSTVQRAARLEQAKRTTPRRSWHFPSFLVGGAVTAALVVGLGIGLWMGGGPRPAPGIDPYVSANTVEWSQAAFRRGLQAHFRSSRLDLREVSDEAAKDRRLLAEGLLEQNRAYVNLALEHDEPELARVLRSFQPVLLRLVAEDLSAEEAARLRSRLEFEISVMLTNLARGTSDERIPTTQESTI